MTTRMNSIFSLSGVELTSDDPPSLDRGAAEKSARASLTFHVDPLAPLAEDAPAFATALFRPLAALGNANAALSEKSLPIHATAATEGVARPDAAAGAPLPNANGNASTIIPVSSTGNPSIDGILSGTRWNTTHIDYSAPDSAADYQSGYLSDANGDGTSAQREDFSQLTAQQKLALHAALNQDLYTQLKGAVGFSVEGFTNLSIGYQGAGAGNATIRAANSGDPGTAYAYYPDNSIYGGDIFFGNTYDGTQFSLKEPTAGNYAWHTVLHEAGHALGLKHGNEAGGPGDTAVPAQYNSIEFTVMTDASYIGDSGGGYDYEAFGAPQTYMMLDILALQTLYGADFTANGGNTVYTWNPKTGQASVNGELAIDPAGNRIFSTIWDGNGNDTYDLSNYTTPMRIDLRPGESSTFSEVQLAFLGGGPNGGFARGNVFNALQFDGDARSLIENANGGSNNDTIIGNATANVLRGNGGNDMLDGGTGNDILDGGTGNDTLLGGVGRDTLQGGSGTDVASYLAATAGVRASLFNSSNNTGEATGDTYSLIENLTGSSYRDVLYGDGNNNRLSGAAGDDTFVGHGGADTLIGDGGADTASYAGAPTGVVAQLGNPAANTGYAAGDTYSSIENLFGSAYADGLYGNSGNNAINGGAGNDLIDGGSGNDLLTGAAGADTFRFAAPLNAKTNLDAITDFSVGSDEIELAHAIFSALGIGPLSAAAFQANSSGLAADASDRIIYETDNGALFYDSNGNASGGRTQFASLDAGLALTHLDFLIV